MDFSKDFSVLLLRDLNLLKQEIEAYKDEEKLWLKKGEINNAAGNLALHICGNLRHFIGAVLLKDGYQRNRKFEFEGKVKKSKILNEIAQAMESVSIFFRDVENHVYKDKYPLEVLGYEMTTFYFIVHLHGHLNYHLGQINYHRRMLNSG
ncbi:MAG: DUF1572 family protein [Ekhidna sp.]|nr:DUF1572 family protein [Ekhidna sp.]